MQQEFLERFLFPGNRAGVRALLRRGSLNAGKAWIGGRLRRQQPILKCCVLGPRSLAGWNQGSHSSISYDQIVGSELALYLGVFMANIAT